MAGGISFIKQVMDTGDIRQVIYHLCTQVVYPQARMCYTAGGIPSKHACDIRQVVYRPSTHGLHGRWYTVQARMCYTAGGIPSKHAWVTRQNQLIHYSAVDNKGASLATIENIPTK